MSIIVVERRSTSRGPKFGAIGAVLALALGVFSPAAGATPSAGLVYSVDGGATWSSTVNAAPGQTVLARVFFTNDSARAIGATSVTTSVPAGFTRVAGSTRVCLSPGTSDAAAPSGERACNTDPGQGGPINEAAVWSGSNLTISPSAGLLGQSPGQANGTMPAGRKRYLTLTNCDYDSSGEHFTSSISTSPLSGWFGAGTAASNGASGGVPCGSGALGYSINPQNSGVQDIPLLAERYLLLENCDYQSGFDHYTDSISTTPSASRFRTGTGSDNSIPVAATCGPGGGGYVPVPANTGVQGMDLVAGRYLHLDNCVYAYGGDFYTDSVRTTPLAAMFRAGTNLSNTPSANPSCGPGGNTVISPLVSGVQNIDLLDTGRGQGYVEFQITAPSPAARTTYVQTGHLSGGATSTTTGSITVDRALSGPLFGNGIVAGLVGSVAMASAATALTRRRSAVG